MAIDAKNTQRLDEVVAEDLEWCYQRLRADVGNLAGSTVLVSGAAGFIGSYLVDFLAYLNRWSYQAPVHIIAVDNYSSGKRDNIAHLQGRADVSIMEVDVSDPLQISGEVHYFIHAASIASPVVYRRHPVETMRANVYGTWNLLELSRRAAVRGFLFLSSSEIYGDPPPQQVPTPESYWGNVNTLGPRACYDESKRLGETLCINYFRLHQIPVKICRLFNVYGPRMALGDGRLIADLMCDTIAGRPLTLYSDGRATRSFCYVSDALFQILSVLLRGPNGEVFNVGNDQEVTVQQVADLVAKTIGGGRPVVHRQHKDKDYVTDNPHRRCPDLSRIRALTASSPFVGLESGLLRTARWYSVGKTS